MNGFDAETAYETDAGVTATEEKPQASQATRVESGDETGVSSPDPMFPTDRYRLAMPYADRL